MWDRFFQKEFGKSGSQQIQKIENPKLGGNRFKIDANRFDMGLKILPDRFKRVLDLFWYDVKSILGIFSHIISYNVL